MEATPVDGLEVVQELGREGARAPIMQEQARRDEARRGEA